MAGTERLVRAFAEWVDRVLVEHAKVPTFAYNFNLYEHSDSFAVQLIGAVRYDSDDPAWACEESFSSGEDLFNLPRALVGDDWRDGLLAAQSLIRDYLRQGAHAGRLTSSRAVCVGFVDGDLEIVHAQQDA